MICENCKKVIKKKEWYFKVEEMKDNKILSIKCVHKNCQDDFNNKLVEERITPKQAEELKGLITSGIRLLKQQQARRLLAE